MLDFTVSERKLQSALSLERYIHTMGVVKAAKKLAVLYNANMNKVSFAALLHDCAKDYPEDMKLRFCREYHVQLDDVAKKIQHLYTSSWALRLQKESMVLRMRKYLTL